MRNIAGNNGKLFSRSTNAGLVLSLFPLLGHQSSSDLPWAAPFLIVVLIGMPKLIVF